MLERDLWYGADGVYHLTRCVRSTAWQRSVFTGGVIRVRLCDSTKEVPIITQVPGDPRARPTLDNTPTERLCGHCLEIYNAETDPKRTG